MSTDIATQTLKEHQRLINLIDELVTALRRLPKDVQWGRSSWAQDSEILDFIRIQTLSLQNAEKNTIEGYYRDAYHLIRMVFEGYFILRLISTCDKYPLRIRIKRAKSDPSLNHAKDRLIQQVRQKLGNRLITTYAEDKNILVAVLRGILVVDDKGKDTGVIVPYYYGAWHDFRPLEYFVKGEKLQDRLPTLRFLTGEWAAMPRRIKSETAKNYGALYKYFLTFDRILENLRLNGILDKKTTTRVLVHYNFLSNFSHSTSDSLSVLRERKFYQLSPDGLDIVYNHYLSELALLYVCHLLSMHLQHAIYYLRWRAIKLKNEIKIYWSLCKKVEDEFGYFWFIFNKPHQYDRYSHANRKCNYKKKIFYRPEDIRLGDVRYYDNPLYRLKQLHQTQRELLAGGNIFVSPFPRDDALF
jgi:hypothetical protein